MTSTVIICEDDLSQLQQLDSIVRNYSIFHQDEFKLGISTQSPDEVIEFVDRFKIQAGIYFFDIDLHNNIDGISLAKKIKAKDSNPRFIFVTTHDEMAISAMQVEVRAFNFILKDSDLNSFMDTIRRTLVEAFEDIEKSEKQRNISFSFSIGTRTINLNFNDILFILTSDIPHQVDLYTINEKYSFYDKLNNIEKKYPKMFRANRSCLINPFNIGEIDYSVHELTFDNFTPIKFSNRKSSQLKKIMNNLN